MTAIIHKPFPSAAPDKPRLVPVFDPSEIEAIKASWDGALDSIVGGCMSDGKWYADADELKRWRARRAASNAGAP